MVQNNGIRSWRTAIGDVNDAGRWLIEQGIADPSKLAIVGWSYGGYAALQSQVVDPGVVQGGRRDRAGHRSEGWEMKRLTPPAYSAGRRLSVGGATVREGSPARNVARFLAPVLMFQGDVDQNVAITSAADGGAARRGGQEGRIRRIRGATTTSSRTAWPHDMLGKSDAFLRRH